MGQSAEFVKRIKKYSYVGNFCNLGFAMVYTNKRGYNFIDKEGNELLDLECSKVVVYRGGLLIITDKRMSTVRYVDTSFRELDFIGPNMYIYGSRFEYDMGNIQYSGVNLYLHDFEGSIVILGTKGEDQVLYNIAGEIIYKAKCFEVIRNAFNRLLVRNDATLVDLTDNITLKLQSSGGGYDEYEKFRIYGNNLWYNKKLVPIIGWDNYIKEDGSIILNHWDTVKTNDGTIPPKFGTAIRIETYNNKRQYKIQYGEFMIPNNMNKYNSKEIVWQRLTLPEDGTIMDMKKIPQSQISRLFLNATKKERQKEEFKLNMIAMLGLLSIILVGILMLLL